MPTGKLPRQETRAPYTRNAPRRQDNILQAASNKLGSWNSCFRVDTEARNGDCRHSRDTRQSRKLLARVDKWWYLIGSMMAFVIAEIIDGFAQHAFAMYPELYFPPAEPFEQDSAGERKAIFSGARQDHRGNLSPNIGRPLRDCSRVASSWITSQYSASHAIQDPWPIRFAWA